MSKVSNRPLAIALGLTLAAALLAAPADAQKKPPTRSEAPRTGPIVLTAQEQPAEPGKAPRERSETRASLRDEYRALRDDNRFRALEARLAGNMKNPAVVDDYLAYMPISPLEFIGDRHAGAPLRDRDPEASSTTGTCAGSSSTRARPGRLYGDDLRRRRGRRRRGGGRARGRSRPATKAIPSAPTATSPPPPAPAPETYQGEIQLAVNPNNPNQIVAAANTWDTIGGTCAGGIQAVFYSSDGGANWDYTCPPAPAPTA